MILSRRTKLIQRAVSVSVFALMAACVAPLPPEQGVVDIGTMKKKDGIVFGILEPNYYNSKGERLTAKAVPEMSYTLFYGTAENLGVKRALTGLSDSIDGNTRYSETFFAMKLPAGEYSMFKVYRPFSGTIGFIPTDIRFKVAPNKATYIGSLQIDFRATRGLFGDERVGEKVAFKVSDDLEKATKVYKERNPSLGYEITTNLMKVEELDE